MDITDLDPARLAKAGADMTLRHPVTGAELPITITVLGQDADGYRQVLRRQLDRRLAAEPLSAETLEREHAERLAGVTTGWRGMTYAGAAFPYSPENAEKLYQEQIWIRDQVQEFTAQRDNFFLTCNSGS